MLRKAFLFLLLSSALSYLSSQLLNHYSNLKSDLWPAALIFYVVTGILFMLVYQLAAKAKNFAQVLLVCLVLKLLLCLIYIFYFSIGYKEQFAAFAAHFLCHFAIFTCFEVLFLLSFIKRITQSTQP